MSGAILLLAAGGAIYSGTLTVGDDGAGVSYGYAVGNWGSLSPLTFVSRDGNTRTILALGYNTSTGGLSISLSGSVSNSDAAAFVGLIVGGSVYLRSAATYSSPANSSWTWTPGSNVIGTSGTKAIQLL